MVHFTANQFIDSTEVRDSKKCSARETTVASCERSFSALKLIKTHLRTTMTHDRHSNLGVTVRVHYSGKSPLSAAVTSPLWGVSVASVLV